MALKTDQEGVNRGAFFPPHGNVNEQASKLKHETQEVGFGAARIKFNLQRPGFGQVISA